MKIPLHLRRVLGMMSVYRGRVALAMLGMLMTASTEPALAALMKALLDRGFTGQLTFSLWLIPAAVIGIFIFRGMSTFMTTYMMQWASTRLLNRLRQLMFNRILDVAVDFYADNPVGRVINSMMFEVQQIIDMIKNVLSSMVRDTLTVLGLLAYLFYLNWRLTLVAIVLLPLIAVIVRTTGRRLRLLTHDYLKINGELTQVIEEATRAQQVIKVFGGQQYERTRFEERAERMRQYSMKMSSTFAATVPITQIMSACALSVVIVIALIQTNQNQTTIGGFVSFITAMLMLITPLKHLAEVNGPLQRGLAASEAVFALIDAPPERTGGVLLSVRASGRLEFADVSFSYPGTQQPALRHVNLVINPGETIAFVGTSGGGKSTLVNLVPNFFPASSGEILLDGMPIESIAVQSLRAQMAMVSQTVVLFDDTVAANIAYGDANPSRERVQAAAKAAHLDQMIAQLPHGLDTLVGDNGSRLSGGQRQRLAIARAIYKDAPILILDEATSALDSESERAVQAALERLMQGRTTLVIAHRLSTIERANRIVVLVEGEIAEIGSHTELLNKGGVYANLYQLQFAKEIGV
jgi:subfamily B ATP-binding cassette protein MsbA